MDTNFSSLAIVVSSVVFLVTLVKVTTSLFKSKSNGKKLNLPPGPRKLPFIGNLHLFASYRPPHRPITELGKKYGPLMHLKFGEINSIVVSSPEMAYEVLKKHDITFGNRPTGLVLEVLFYKNSDFSFAPYGDYWRMVRKICTIELLSAKRVQSFRQQRMEEFSNMCRKIGSNAGSVIDLKGNIEWGTCDTLTRILIGKKTKEQEKFVSNVKEIVDLTGGFYLPDIYPSVKLFRLFGGMRERVERLHKVFDGILETIINEHKEADPESKKREDLIDVLLSFNEPGRELYITMDNVKAIILDFFSAGIETSSAALEWTMAELLRNPRVLKKAQDEVRQVFDNRGFVDETDFDQLTYLKLVIKESLRMHPPAPLSLARESRERCEINGYEIPAKTTLMVNVWAMGRDPRNWNEPESFNPERFLDKPADYKGNNFDYLPFGGGRRICPGMTFGVANIELPLAMLLYHFDWVLPDGIEPENMDMTENYSIVVAMKNPLLVIPIVKNPLPNA